MLAHRSSLSSLLAALAVGTLGCNDDGLADPAPPVVATGTTGTPPSPSTSSGAASTGVADSTGGSTAGGSEDSGTTGPGIQDPGCPACMVLADGLMSGRGITTDLQFVYFTDQERGTVERVQKGGGEGLVIAMDQAQPYDVAVADEHVFWTTFVGTGSVQRVVLPDGPPITIASDLYPRAIQTSGGFVYWTTFDDLEGRVRRMPADGVGQTPETLVSVDGGVPSLFVEGPLVYFTAHVTPDVGSFIEPPRRLPLGGVYAASSAAPTAFADLTELSTFEAQPWGVASSGNFVFWANGVGDPANLPDRLRSTAADGTAQPSTLAPGQTAPWGVAVDAQYVYWTDHTEVKAIPHAGGDVIVLAEMQNIARSITVDDQFVYWITRERVLQRPKP
ncbi:MAG: hypothetical protein K0V04_19825 [Deltaproteobacteria bacterium]|nr:hypothetical protein [Deltaproteobacteria bacterium]